MSRHTVRPNQTPTWMLGPKAQPHRDKRHKQKKPSDPIKHRLDQLATNWHYVVDNLNEANAARGQLVEEVRMCLKRQTEIQVQMTQHQKDLEISKTQIRQLVKLAPMIESLRKDIVSCEQKVTTCGGQLEETQKELERTKRELTQSKLRIQLLMQQPQNK